MNYVYHGVPDDMRGDKLIPLNQMHDSMPELRAEYLKKYEGREEILRKTVSLLDCVWNDVVQFLPLHPQKIFELQVELGLIPKVPPYRFYEIDIDTFDSKKTAVYFKSAPGEENTKTMWLKDVDLTTIQEIPKATIEYYNTLIGTGELPFNYQFVPHVLFKGDVDISKSKIITI